jgi:TATA-binding protein-associated factor Taf7
MFQGMNSFDDDNASGTAGTERSEQVRASLVEKNRLLTGRVAELETKLEAKKQRIDSFTADQ